MANLEKHKKNPVQEWLAGEDSSAPAQPRSSRVLGSFIKISKPSVSGRSRAMIPPAPVSKVEPALAREPALPAKVGEKHSQATSREHLLKSERVPKLRAPFSATPARNAKGRPPR